VASAFGTTLSGTTLSGTTLSGSTETQRPPPSAGWRSLSFA